SKPMIDGVMMRLFVAVWKLTVAIAWQKATIAMTVTLVARISAMRQNPSVPYGIGLSQASRPAANPAASTISTLSSTQYRRRARRVGSACDEARTAGMDTGVVTGRSVSATATLPEEEGDEDDRADDAEVQRDGDL